VGKAFPTFIAMKLREIYHTGDTRAPPIFIVNISMEEDKEPLFAEQLEMMKALSRSF
jgi:hypothetical protein